MRIDTQLRRANQNQLKKGGDGNTKVSACAGQMINTHTQGEKKEGQMIRKKS